MMMTKDERAAMHRTFLLRVSPHIGHALAEKLGGFLSPSLDGMQHDLRDTLTLWFRLHNAGGLHIVKDTAWWMARLQDQYARMSKEETDQQVDQLASYAVATIGLLIDQGVLQFAKEVEVPKILLSDEDPDADEDPVLKAILERMEATLKENDDE